MQQILFETLDKKKWIKVIVDTYNNTNDDIALVFSKEILVSKLMPMHLVTLACLIDSYIKLNKNVYLSDNNKDVFQYLVYDLKFSLYFNLGKDYAEPEKSDNIFNLWRINNEEKDLYPKEIEKYFKKVYFKNKDLSPISEALIEAYYNVFDHSNSNGNAFSLLMYDKETNILYASISDFGKGIAKSVRENDQSIQDDIDAMENAIKDNYTIKSQSHNRGFGLGNILSSTNITRILCNSVTLINKYKKYRIFETGFDYPGTLIDFEINLSVLEDEEYIELFNFDDF